MAKTAIITGASSGIGRESAVALSKAGWNLVLTARRLDQLNETAQLCLGETLVLAGSITDEPFVKSVFEAATARFGRLDLLFNVNTLFTLNVIWNFYLKDILKRMLGYPQRVYLSMS